MDRRFPVALALAAALALGQEHHIPEQPVDFSHKRHAALALKCRECHASADPGKAEGLPAASKCMACHFSIANDNPQIQKLKRYADQKQEIPWVPVYEVPDFVKFSHQAHTRFPCEKCHGKVETRDALWRETDLTMGGCVACHRQNRASTKCRACHEDRR